MKTGKQYSNKIVWEWFAKCVSQKSSHIWKSGFGVGGGGEVNFNASGGCLGSVSERHIKLYLMDPAMNLAVFVKKL
jgi:hypothetical protein